MGAIQLPIPIFCEGKIYKEATLKPIQASIIADSNKEVQKGNNYRAIQIFLAGGIASIDDVTDKQRIKSLVGKMPFKSAWLLVVKTIMADEKDDGVEGLYECPRCHQDKVCEYNEDESLDTRDYISDLETRYYEEDKEVLELNLEHLVKIEDADGGEQAVSKIELVFPSLDHCAMAYEKVGGGDEIRLQFAVYVQALHSVDGIKIDKKFRKRYGMSIFERMEKNDSIEIGRRIDEYGLITKVEKICTKCNKNFKVNLNTANFFVSALQ